MPTPIQLETERMLSYGPPSKCHAAIAQVWSAYLAHRRSRGVQLFDHDVAIMMVLLKLVRAAYSPSHLDNYDDAMAYLTFARRFISGEDERRGGGASVAGSGYVEAPDQTGNSQSIRVEQE